MNETLMIVSSENKKNILLNKKGLENIKYIGFRELKEKLSFSIDERALYEVVKQEKLSVSNAKIILENLYMLDEEVDANNVKNLKRIYKYLDEMGLIIRDNLFKIKLKSWNVILYGRDFLDIEEEKLLGEVNYSFLDIKKYERSIPVSVCENVEDEVRNLAKNIVKLVREGVNFDNIKIINLSDETRMCCEKIFPRYNIPSNIHVGKCLYSLPLFKELLNVDDIYEGLENLKNKVSNEEGEKVLEVVLRVFNKYAKLPKDDITNKIILEELKNTKIQGESINNAVSEGTIDTIYSEDDYIFIVNFNQGVMPRIYKDEDFLSDKIKSMLGRVTSTQKTLNEKKCVKYFLEHNKNVFISYSKRNSKEITYPSSFLDEINVEIKPVDNSFDGSNLDNKIILSRGLDNYYKYGEVNDDVKTLLNSYEDLPYNSYDNKFSGLSLENKNEISKNIVLSSTSMDSFNRCSFRYYLSYILKVDRYDETFMKDVGNLIHYVLSKYSSDGFVLRNEWDNYISENNIGKDAKSKFFLEKLFRETEFIISEIKRQKSYSVLSDEYYEKKFCINIFGDESKVFMGIIDKIMFNKDEKLVSIVDYKTGNVSLDLSLIKYGIGMQLPVYLYLLSKSSEFKDYDVIGFYLQKIINSEIVRQENKSYLEQKSKNLYLQGYSLGEEDKLSKFDSSYEDSKVIKGLKKSSKGFYAYSKLLSKDEMTNIITSVSNTIVDVSNKISDGQFDINPKRVGLENVGCKFCDFKDICFMSEKNIVNLEEKSEECEMDA